MQGKGVFCQKSMSLSSLSNLHTFICKSDMCTFISEIISFSSCRLIFLDLANPCQCKCVDKYLLDSGGALKPSSQRLYRHPAPLVGNYTLYGMHRHKHFTVVTAWIKPCLVFLLIRHLSLVDHYRLYSMYNIKSFAVLTPLRNPPVVLPGCNLLFGSISLSA